MNGPARRVAANANQGLRSDRIASSSSRLRPPRWIAGLLLSAGFLLAGASAQAAITVNKTFSPSSMTVGGTSTITITLGNTGTVAATSCGG